MFEKVKRFAKKVATSKKTQMTCLMMVCGVTALMAQTTAGDYSAGTAVYIAMNNEEQDVKKKIMMVVGACIFLIAAAQALPLFFGIS